MNAEKWQEHSQAFSRFLEALTPLGLDKKKQKIWNCAATTLRFFLQCLISFLYPECPDPWKDIFCFGVEVEKRTSEAQVGPFKH